jgi:hypothetical protein
MGSAYYIKLEKEIEGLDTAMDGKSLARHMNALDEAARKLNIKPLSEFLSMSSDEYADLLGEEDKTLPPLPPLEQFSAEEGLKSVRALLGYTPIHADHVVVDLSECERILTVAAEHGVGWHFQIDI